MSQDIRRITPEEMDRRFDDLRAIKGGGSAEIFASVAQKWGERKGETITAGMVRKYYNKIQHLDKRGVNLHEIARVHTWSYIIWKL